jgi:hypothetical protein
MMSPLPGRGRVTNRTVFDVRSLCLRRRSYSRALLVRTDSVLNYLANWPIVRLVFRPYTQIRRTICTSVSLRASTRVSPGFALSRHSSPSFGSQRIRSYSNLSQVTDRSMVHPCGIPPQATSLLPFTFIAHLGFAPKYSRIR